MNINRHNYESFFLLYVDKELSAADKKAVDVFVQQNPDLKMELALLQQTVMPVDDVVLQKKDWLYMEEDISALQENLLLYADDELSAADKKSVESLLKTNATAKAELALLQQAKLQPDMDVVFEDKALLYRKEGGRVVGFKWWRVAAAAVLLGFGLWTGVSVYKNNFESKAGTEGIVKGDKTKPGQQKTAAPVTDENLATQKVEVANAADNIATAGQQKNTNAAEQKINNAVEKINNNNIVARNQSVTEQNSSNKKPDNNLPKPYFENINKSGSNETIVRNVQSQNNNNVRVSGSNNDAVVKISPKENKATIDDINNSKTNATLTAMNVANTNTDANDETNAQYLNVDGKEKRTALGGFLRKAKRVIERTTNVKTGEGVKIAGFEIALK